MRVPLALVLVCSSGFGLLACETSSPNEGSAGSAAADGGIDADASVDGGRFEDLDGDGLCDGSERDLGTNPESNDSDADGVPDLVEWLNAYDPLSPSSPALDQLAFLEATPGAVTDFELRLTVDGNGLGYTGQLQSYAGFYEGELTASDFFVTSAAVSATPPDNVRDLEADRARFGQVTGRTRLRFRASFNYVLDTPFLCAQPFAFRYSVKADDGERPSARDYLLIVTPEGSERGDASSYCVPPVCL